jgi:2-succinyl-5-enolpyruvyl-6-hydroxy-3-cyclohexene-1-carboxylate synthase
MTADLTTSFAVTIVDEFVRGGLTHAVVSPGSRNTPLSLALVRDGRVQVDVVLDERSAGFRALGIARATGRPVLVGCTSGSAAANLHPAVVEAFHARVPLLVCTADRPPELQGVGAPQTIDQVELFGTAVRAFFDAGPPGDDPSGWRPLADDAMAAATASPAGPVHVNLPFREPLLPTGAPLLDVEPLSDPSPLRGVSKVRPAHLRDASGARRGVLVAGWGSGVDAAVVEAFATRTGWPVLADSISNLRTGPHAITMYEALLRNEQWAAAHQPEIVVRIGAPLTSKVANAWLDRAPHTVLIDADGVWRDPARVATERVQADPQMILPAITAAADRDWSDGWARAEQAARTAFDNVIDEGTGCEARIARDIASAIPDGGGLVVASSMPVRALEWAMPARGGLTVYANRGANGIDGFVSTALGIATGRTGPTVAFCGDLCFLHDTNGLLSAPASPPVTFIVVDNGGGGIFSYLPQHALAEFDQLFLTPQPVDVVAVARAHGVDAERVANGSDVASVVAEHADRTRVLVVPVDGPDAVARHRAAFAAVASRT